MNKLPGPMTALVFASAHATMMNLTIVADVTTAALVLIGSLVVIARPGLRKT